MTAADSLDIGNDFFRWVLIILGAVLAFNLANIAVQYAISGSVFICSEVTKSDPIDVQKKCGRSK